MRSLHSDFIPQSRETIAESACCGPLESTSREKNESTILMLPISPYFTLITGNQFEKSYFFRLILTEIYVLKSYNWCTSISSLASSLTDNLFTASILVTAVLSALVHCNWYH